MQLLRFPPSLRLRQRSGEKDSDEEKQDKYLLSATGPE